MSRDHDTRHSEYIGYRRLCKFYMLYRKKFYPKEHFEITQEDGANRLPRRKFHPRK